MQLPSTYTTQEKLKSLSERLGYLARDKKNAYATYINTNLKSENLQYNLSLTISHIILKLKFIDRNKGVFEQIIDEYNEANNTSLTFDDFEKIGWVRIISDEVVMPRLINSFVWRVGYYEKEGKPIEIPKDKTDITRCLQIYYEYCFKDAKLTITQSELGNILSEFASKEVTLDFLKEREIISFDKANNLYSWHSSNEYTRHLRNEIASTLWLLISREKATLAEFKLYFKLTKGAGIWIESLNGYLSHGNISNIVKLAVDFLNTEIDLLKSDNEFEKIWLDSENYTHVQITDKIPVVQFNYNNTFDFIESVNHHKFRHYEAFGYQSTRSFCYSILRIIVSNEPKHPQPFQNSLRILKDTSKPYLVWTLYSEIPKHFPFLIPYLLTDTELVPIAFKLIDKIEVDEDFLKELSGNNDRKEEERLELVNQLWFEVFNYILEQFSSFHSNDDEKGKVIAKVLIDLAENVFKHNAYNTNNNIRHNALRKRYDEALKLLSNHRLKQFNVHPAPLINPRIIISLLPYISDYLKNKLTTTYPRYSEFLNVESGLFDLSIEILRLTNMRFAESEVSNEQNEKLIETTEELVTSLNEYLTGFYIQKEIEILDFDGRTEKKKARRGVTEFGFEIIDWGLLFLLFEKYGTLESFNNKFSESLDFKTDADKYDEQNKEQFEKIKLYIKSLMLGFISINQKKSLYEFSGLPVNDTLFKLEQYIKELSLLYSVDDLHNKRIDAFNETLSVFGYDMYHQHLISLLYKSINYFKDATADEFVKTYFASSNDIRQMLTAINILDSKEQRNIISQRISDVKIAKYIDQVFTITELQYALIEAINSESHWEKFTKPLIDRIQAHFKKVQYHDDNREKLLFEVNLLLAFKEKDFNKLSAIEVPEKSYVNPTEDKEALKTKKFYVALFKLYNDKNYDDAITLFNSLWTDNPKNIRYAFHLYQARTLKAISA
jgi:hypothetical protein